MEHKKKYVIEQIGFWLIILGLWQIVYIVLVEILDIWKAYAVPSPVQVGKRAVSVFGRVEIYQAVIYSLQRVITGYVISVVAGSLLGLVIARFQYLERNLKPVILGFQTLPSVCWVSFAILWFGLGSQAVIFVIVISACFSMAMSVFNSLRHVNPLYIRAAKVMGASEFQIYQKVRLPACMPEFVLGLRQTWAFSWRVLMSAEMMISMIGLGQALDAARSIRNDINEVLVIMLVIILIGAAVDSLVFGKLENRMLKKRGLVQNE